MENLVSELSKLPQTDLGVEHHFSDGLYAKEMHLPQGHTAVSHVHTYSHLSILATGRAHLVADGVTQTLTAPCCIEIKAGVQHIIEALENLTWFCIHRTDETDIHSIDQVLIKEK